MQKSENNKNLIKEEPKKQEIQPNILKESNSKKTFNEPENKPKETIKTNQIDNKNTNLIMLFPYLKAIGSSSLHFE